MAANDPDSPSLSYRDAGVDIDAGNTLVERIKPAVKSTQRPEVLGGLGGFGGLFELPVGRYRNPVLVSGTDGVGTKLRLAIDEARLEGVGVDLVAMCVNDILVLGAEPLFFLDYYATGRLAVDDATVVVEGIAEGCRQAGAALVGGETAEMPGMYAGNDFDLAGFCVGAAEKDRILTGERVAEGDVLIGLAASGPHSNGYSLIRKVIDHVDADLDADCGGRPLRDALLAPTRIYVESVQALLAAQPVHALSHITGGGLLENLPRVLPKGLAARVDTAAWRRPPVFDWIAENGNVAREEMFRTFNNGIGMVAVVPAEAADPAVATLTAAGEQACVMGRIEARAGGEPVILD